MSDNNGELAAGLELLDLGPSRGRGRAQRELSLVYVRDLTEADIAIAAQGSAVAPVSAIAAVRQSHHTLARLIAEGEGNAEISAITGYAPATVSRMRSDPALVELVAYYAQQKEAQYLDMHSRLATLGATAVEMLQEKLDGAPVEAIGVRTLTEVAEFALDRSVTPQARRGNAAAPSAGSSGVTLNVSFVAPPGGVVIEGKVLDAPLVEGDKK